MDNASFPPVIAILLADVSGFLAGMDEAVASAESTAAAIDSSFADMASAVSSTVGEIDSEVATIEASFAEMAAGVEASLASIDTAALATEATVAESSAGMAASVGGATAAEGGFFASAGGSVDQYASKFAIAGIVVAGVSVAMATSFQDAMLHIQTQAGASQEEVLNMGAAIMSMAGDVGESPKKLAEALYPIESAGIRGGAALDILKLAAEGAQVSGANLESTASALTTVMASGIPGVTTAADAMGQMNAIVGVGKMKFEDLDKAMSSGIVAAAQTFGVSLSSVGAALDTLTINGIPAEQAASRLRMGMALLAAPSKQAAKILGDLGLSTDDANAKANAMAATLQKAGVSTTQLADDMKQPNGIYVALTDLKSHMEKAGLSADEQAAVISRAFGGGRMGTAIMSAFSNLDEMKGKYDQINASASMFPDDWAARQKQFGQSWDDLKAKIDVFLVNIGTRLIPIIESIIDWFSKHEAVAKVLGVIIGVLLVGAFIALGVAILSATWEILLIVAVFALMVGAVVYAYTHWSWFKTAVDAVWHSLVMAKDGFMLIYNFVKNIDWGGLWKGVVDWVEKIPERVGHFLSDTWKTITGWVSTGWSWLVTHMEQWADAAMSWVTKTLTDLPGNLAHLIGFITGWVLTEGLQLPTYFAGWLTAFLGWIWDAITTVVPTLWNFAWKVMEFLQGLPGKIIDWAKENGPGILKWIVEAVSNIDQKLSEFADKVMGFLLDLPGKIIGWIGAADQWLYNIGQDIIHGLIEGAKSVLGELGNLASQAKDGFLNGMKSAFGINSPSLVIAHEIGHPVGEGFIKGVTDSMPKDMTKFVPKMPKVPNMGGGSGGDHMAGVIGGGMGSSGSGQGTGAGDQIVNVYAETNADPNRIASEVAFAMRTI